MRLSWVFYLFILMFTFCGSLLLAANENKPAGAEGNSVIEEDEEDVKNFMQENIAVKVPKNLQNKGLKIRTESAGEISLSGKEIGITTGDSVELVELVTKDSRIIDSNDVLIDELLLTDFRGRFWRAGISGGGVISQNKDEWKKIGQTGYFEEIGIDLGYQPTSLGYSMRVAKVSRRKHKEDLDIISYYQENNVSMHISFEFVPFPTTFFQRIHIEGFVGPMMTSRYIEIKSQDVKERDSSNSIGLLTGLDARYPLINNFWCLGRYAVNYQQAKSSKFDFDATGITSSIQLGGFYYF